MDVGVTIEPRLQTGMGFRQFVALVAALMATNALAVDSMLPALGQIGASLGVTAANERQWVITSYLLGFGAAQIVYGTLADRFGRKPMIMAGLTIYIAASLAAAATRSFELMMFARVIQGIGAAGTRVLAVSIVRDRFAGRQMARVMSLALIVFLAVPICAPSLGQLIMLVLPWQAIFVALAAFASVVLVWLTRNLPETLHPADRHAIDLSHIFAAARKTLSNRISLGYTLAMSVLMGAMIGFINSAQQIFADVFHQPRFFTLIFAGIAGAIAVASLVNARLVDRLGTRLISHAALLGFTVIACVHVAVAAGGHDNIFSFAILQTAMMFCFGLLMGNFGAMSMEPLGHIAGSASSIQGFISTLAGALIGFAIGQCFNGTTVPLTLGFAGAGMIALVLVAYAEGGRLFQARHYAQTLPG
jgi:DHA1 family bicyclomycin/chloramphenicol resistance-like MFS transporter